MATLSKDAVLELAKPLVAAWEAEGKGEYKLWALSWHPRADLRAIEAAKLKLGMDAGIPALEVHRAIKSGAFRTAYRDVMHFREFSLECCLVAVVRGDAANGTGCWL